ncbi:MAG TPA: DNA topoisomerase IB [Ktedonobacteraceae bacterium]|nr:DNA topoisomerase IB [Ktedonobacteraceae bacterium]
MAGAPVPLGAQGLGEPRFCEADDPIEVARFAGLRYVTDTSPGIQRKRAGKNFSYIGLDGKSIRDAKELARIKSLAIPPAWTDVWICPRANGHIQATGRDARGRKQYRYHPKWREVRDATKFDRIIVFGEALPEIRERTYHDLALSGLPYEKVIATVVRLLDTTLIRVGNEEYVRENGTFGLTTMRSNHVDVSGANVHFHFRGKSGKEHAIDVRDRQLAKIVKRCQELPGHELFQYLDIDNNLSVVESDDVNNYLQEITGQNFTAKDFRTWGGTVIATRTLQELGPFSSETQVRKNVVQAIKTAAAELGNTPATCRKCYVHPGIIDAYMDGSLLDFLKSHPEKELTKSNNGLRPEEEVVLAFLRRSSAS